MRARTSSVLTLRPYGRTVMTAPEDRRKEVTLSDWKRKLDSRGRQLIDERDGPEIVDALLRAVRPLDAFERQALINAGARIHTESGIVLTIALNVASLQAVAELDFVTRLEISRPLHAEPTD